MSVLSNLSEEEKEQAKQYADAIKETKKALFELINKAKSRGTQNEGDKNNWGGPRKDLVMPVNENSELKIPKNILDFAKKKGIINKITTMAKWLSEIDKKIVGGTAIGKDYNTIVLDITHQGSEIYYDTENGKLEVNGESIPFNKQKFLQAI